jgi:hypothetical protein
MRHFVEGTDRGQSTLFPECLEDWIGEDNPVRVIDVFVEELDLAELGFSGVDPEASGSMTWPISGSTTRKSAAVHNSIDQPGSTAAASVNGNTAEMMAPIYGTKRRTAASESDACRGANSPGRDRWHHLADRGRGAASPTQPTKPPSSHAASWSSVTLGLRSQIPC